MNRLKQQKKPWFESLTNYSLNEHTEPTSFYKKKQKQKKHIEHDQHIDLWANESYESVLFSESITNNATTIVRFRNNWHL